MTSQGSDVAYITCCKEILNISGITCIYNLEALNLNLFFSPSVTILNKFAKSAHENLKKLRNGLGQKLFFKWDNPEDKFSHNT